MESNNARGTRPALIFVIGPKCSGKTTFSTSIKRLYPQLALIHKTDYPSFDALLDAIFPLNKDTSSSPCIIDGFPGSYGAWTSLTRHINSPDSGVASFSTIPKLVIHLDCLSSIALRRWKLEPWEKCSDEEFVSTFKSQRVVCIWALIKELREEGPGQNLRVVELMDAEEDEVEVAMRKRVAFIKDSEEKVWGNIIGRKA